MTGYDDQGGEIFQRLKLPEVETSLTKARMNRYLYETFLDIAWFANAFPELVLSKDRKQIVGLTS